MFVSEILHPIHPDKFRNEILGKRMHFWKAPPGVSDRFKSLYDWKKLDSFLNNWQNVNHNQLAGLNEKGEATNDGNDKWDKGRDGKLGKSEVYNLWRHGHSIVLPFCEFQSQEMWSVVNTFERGMPFGQGCANMYCSSRHNSHTFDPHQDSTENFLFHIDGSVKWNFYEKEDNKLVKTNSIILSSGDLLYIPIGLIHDTEPLGPRLTASIHFQPKPEKIAKDKMYDWFRWFEYQREIKL